eukprot:NODE_1404_length_1429_cov_115.365217_g1169_i0.p1 GENE.NODE_1404_length_1429_cov_115.365217_g1169_i0~~NODE_1404_length_1429_cov_115.365217_g1169_i0.p1  ORF type:complete len:428 (+),score=171.24 NODE_1404_length_1429_cov_115.365217_g1169_i0:103-1284(+)
MFDILDKLRILNFEKDFCLKKGFKPLTHNYFARASNNPNEQFYYFTSMMAWLMTMCGSGMQPPGQFDDPNSTSTNIIYEMKNMGFSVAQIQLQKLKQGHGESILIALTLLVDKALQKAEFEWVTPVYAPDSYEEEVDVEGDDGDTVEGDVFHKDSDSEEEEYYVGGRAKNTDADAEEVAEIKSSVDPTKWRMELERVAPILKLDLRSDMKDWRSHIDWISAMLKTIDKTFPDVKTILSKVTDDIASALEKIKKREDTLTSQFENHIEQFRVHKKEYNALHEQDKQLKESCDSLQTELSRIKNLVDSAQSEVDELSKSINEITPLNKIKEAMVRIRKEIKQMELRIGVLQHTVMYNKYRDAVQRTKTGVQGGNDGFIEAEGTALPVTVGVGLNI